MLRTGILNPAINSLLSRVRHTNTLVIADRGFPYWPQIETVDISLVDDLPRVMEVLRAIRGNFVIGRVFMAEEFLTANGAGTRANPEQEIPGVSVISWYATCWLNHAQRRHRIWNCMSAAVRRSA
jgi:D-ribose pyranase